MTILTDLRKLRMDTIGVLTTYEGLHRSGNYTQLEGRASLNRQADAIYRRLGLLKRMFPDTNFNQQELDRTGMGAIMAKHIRNAYDAIGSVSLALVSRHLRHDNSSAPRQTPIGQDLIAAINHLGHAAAVFEQHGGR